MSYSPYAPPQAGPQVTTYYRALGWKTMAASVGILATVVLSAGSQVLTTVAGKPSAENLLAVLVIGLVSLATTALNLFATVVFLVWMHNAATNVRAFGQEGLAFTPGWCVGWWFIPVASLFKPYQAMKEIWKASDPESLGVESRGAWRLRDVPGTVRLWWAAYLTGAFIAVAAAIPTVLASLHGEPPTSGNLIMLASLVPTGISAVALYLIMRDLDARQAMCAEKLGL